jgi:AGCS family alanine or glycine:cation symporter
MAVAVHAVFGVPTWVVGVGVAVLTWLVIIGGITSIGRAAERLVPLKVGLYLAGGGVVIVTFVERLPDVLALVVREAWATESAMGFGMFVAMRYGIARGIYANEAGFGTAAVVYGTARSTQPAQQGLQAVMEVFIVSFVTATISALTILLSGVAEQSIALRQRGAEFLTSTAAVAGAFDMAMPVVGGWVVAICALLFGYTTLIGWAYYGEQFLEYLVGGRVTVPYRWAYCLLIPFGAVLTPEVVWAWGDLMNALQIFPNLIGLVGLSGIAATYARQRPFAS